MFKSIGKVMNASGSLATVIPHEIVKACNIQPGDEVIKIVDILNHRVILQFPGHESGFSKNYMSAKTNSLSEEQFKIEVSRWRDLNSPNNKP